MKLTKTKLILYLILTAVIIFGILNWEKAFINLQHKFFQIINKKSSVNLQSSIDTFTFYPKAFLGENKEVKVYLPKSYYENSDKKFPVLYLLHGFPGNDMDWLTNGNMQNTLDELTNNNSIPPTIVVFPDGNGPVIHDSQYLDATKINQPSEDYIEEVVSEIDARYRSLNERGSRAIGGNSAGAYGAVNIAFHKNNLFSVILSLSGYFINKEDVTKRLLNPSDLKADFNNPLYFLEKNTLDKDTYVFLNIGKLDKPSYIKENEDMDQLLTKNGLVHQFEITGGWHDWDLWRNNIKPALNFMGRYIKSD